MIGALGGDIAGSTYEWAASKDPDLELFPPASRFTDDTVMTIAVAEAILEGKPYGSTMRRWGRRYLDAGYGPRFHAWLTSENPAPYNSFGNGSAMRVSPVGFAFDSLDEVVEQATASAAVSHDHEEGIKGAQAVASVVFLARTGVARTEIRQHVADTFGYDLDRSVAEVRPTYRFDVSCQGSVPEAIICFLESQDVEDAIRLAISLGGDADTLGSMAGAMAQAYFGAVSERLWAEVKSALTQDLAEVLDTFCQVFNVPGHRRVGGTNGGARLKNAP